MSSGPYGPYGPVRPVPYGHGRMPSRQAGPPNASANRNRNRNDRDSNALRASVLDVFTQLGALQKDSLITQWMFDGVKEEAEEVEGRGRGRGQDEARLRDQQDWRRQGGVAKAREEAGHGYGYRGSSNIDTRLEGHGGAREDVKQEEDAAETRRGGRSKFSSKITAVFRGRSKSRTRAEKEKKGSKNSNNHAPPLPVSAGYETDEGYNSSSPSAASGKGSKSRRRGISVFPNTARPSESSDISSRPSTPSEFSGRPSRDRTGALSPLSSIASRDRSGATSPFSDVSVPFPSVPIVPNARARFGRTLNEPLAVDDQEGISEGRVSRESEWEQFPPLTPGAFEPKFVGAKAETQGDKTPDVGDNVKGDSGNLLRRLSFAIPRTNFQNPVKRKNTRRPRPPSLLPIQTIPPPDFDSEHDAEPGLGGSKSLPPSPFILVRPELGAAEFGGTPDTPYIVCTPMDDATAQARLSQPLQPNDSPVYPLSVSKTIRRSLVLDNMNHSDENLPLSTPNLDPDQDSRLNRAMSMQGPSSYTNSSRRVYFADQLEGQRPGLRRSLSATQRGRESPFPSRPVLPVPLSLSIYGPNARAVRMSLDARASVIRQRYRSGAVVNFPEQG